VTIFDFAYIAGDFGQLIDFPVVPHPLAEAESESALQQEQPEHDLVVPSDAVARLWTESPVRISKRQMQDDDQSDLQTDFETILDDIAFDVALRRRLEV
jgi:hypothetical protein